MAQHDGGNVGVSSPRDISQSDPLSVGVGIDVDALLEDEYLDALFAQMEPIVASGELRQAALGAMMGAVAGSGAAGGEAVSQDNRRLSELAGGAAARRAIPGAHFSTVRPKPRARRAIAIAAAACLALGMLGGAAYAIPTSYVSVEGSTSYELGIDIFGMTVSATASDESGNAVLSDIAVCNRSFGQSISTLLGAIDDEEVLVTVASDIATQKSALVDESAGVLAELDRSGGVIEVDASVRREARDAGVSVGRLMESRDPLPGSSFEDGVAVDGRPSGADALGGAGFDEAPGQQSGLQPELGTETSAGLPRIDENGEGAASEPQGPAAENALQGAYPEQGHAAFDDFDGTNRSTDGRDALDIAPSDTVAPSDAAMPSDPAILSDAAAPSDPKDLLGNVGEFGHR